MKITRIAAYQVDLPVHEGSYNWSGGKSVSVFDSTVVRVETDEGVTGHGEVCPLGPFYLASYAAGVRAGIAELAPDLLGLAPRELGVLDRRMDALLKGHPYVKSALDMACWDILGKAAGLPVLERSAYTMIADDDEVSLHHHRRHALTPSESLQLGDKLRVHLKVHLLVLNSIIVQIVQERV